MLPGLTCLPGGSGYNGVTQPQWLCHFLYSRSLSFTSLFSDIMVTRFINPLYLAGLCNNTVVYASSYELTFGERFAIYKYIRIHNTVEVGAVLCCRWENLFKSYWLNALILNAGIFSFVFKVN